MSYAKPFHTVKTSQAVCCCCNVAVYRRPARPRCNHMSQQGRLLKFQHPSRLVFFFVEVITFTSVNGLPSTWA